MYQLETIVPQPRSQNSLAQIWYEVAMSKEDDNKHWRNGCLLAYNNWTVLLVHFLGLPLIENATYNSEKVIKSFAVAIN